MSYQSNVKKTDIINQTTYLCINVFCIKITKIFKPDGALLSDVLFWFFAILPIIQNVMDLDLDLDSERGERGGRWELTETLPEQDNNQDNEDDMRIEIRMIRKKDDEDDEREEEGGRWLRRHLSFIRIRIMRILMIRVWMIGKKDDEDEGDDHDQNVGRGGWAAFRSSELGARSD